MNDDKFKGGAAFPSQSGYDYKGERVTQTNEGMELMDYLAARAMQGILAASGDSRGEPNYDEEIVAHSAYLMADAMLKERKKW